MTREDIAKIIRPLRSRKAMREAVEAAASEAGQTHNVQGHPVWDALEGFEDFDKAKES